MGDTLWAKALNFTPYNPTNYGMIDKNEHGIFFLTGKHISTSQSSTNYYSILGKLDFNGDLILLSNNDELIPGIGNSLAGYISIRITSSSSDNSLANSSKKSRVLENKWG